MGRARIQNGDHRLPKIVLYGELSTGHRDRGAPKKRYKDSLKKSLSTCHIDHRQWSALAMTRGLATCRTFSSSFESNRANAAILEEKRSRRKNRVATAPTPESSFPCIGSKCLSRIGLVSHQRACARRGQRP